MTLGEQFKQLRQQQGLSQPQLAELAGIEQSYLSKLENDKSLPSNDIFRRLIAALNVSIEQLLSPLDHSLINNELKQITDIEYWLSQQTTKTFEQRRGFLLVSSLLIVIAVTLFYAGLSKEVFPELRYLYLSKGVVLEGEPDNIFREWRQQIDMSQESNRGLIESKRAEIAKRIDEKTIQLEEYTGERFVQPVAGGSRTYVFWKEKQFSQPINVWLKVLGVFLFTADIMGFVLEWKLFNKN
ncbi:helix-turn-helix domain-containing protein [Colwellia sp. MEBiC06753]